MGLTIAYSLAASLIVALTVVPMMSAGLLQRTEEKEIQISGDNMQEGYSQLILKALHHKTWVLLGRLALFIVSAILSIKKGTEFFPSMESTQVTMMIRKGNTLGRNSG